MSVKALSSFFSFLLLVISVVVNGFWMLLFLVCLAYPYNYVVAFIPFYVTAYFWLKEVKRRENVKPFWLTAAMENTPEEREEALKFLLENWEKKEKADAF